MGQARDTIVGRLGLVLYWAGIFIAVTLGVFAFYVFFFSTRIPNPEREALSLAFFAVVSFLVGRAALFVLAGK